MNYEETVQAVREAAPELVIDPQRAGAPNLVVVRRVAGGTPFSITCPVAPPDPDRGAEDTRNEELRVLGASIDQALAHLPPLPAPPE